MVFQSAGEEAEIHDARWGGETQAVGCDQALVAVGTLHEFVAEAGAPVRSVGRGLGKGLKMQPAGVVASDFDGEGVVEAEWRAKRKMESLRVFRLNAIVDRVPIGAWRVLG